MRLTSTTRTSTLLFTECTLNLARVTSSSRTLPSQVMATETATLALYTLPAPRLVTWAAGCSKLMPARRRRSKRLTTRSTCAACLVESRMYPVSEWKSTAMTPLLLCVTSSPQEVSPYSRPGSLRPNIPLVLTTMSPQVPRRHGVNSACLISTS